MDIVRAQAGTRGSWLGGSKNNAHGAYSKPSTVWTNRTNNFSKTMSFQNRQTTASTSVAVAVSTSAAVAASVNPASRWILKAHKSRHGVQHARRYGKRIFVYRIDDHVPSPHTRIVWLQIEWGQGRGWLCCRGSLCSWGLRIIGAFIIS